MYLCMYSEHSRLTSGHREVLVQLTFDINHIIKEPDGLHVQKVADPSSTNLRERQSGRESVAGTSSSSCSHHKLITATHTHTPHTVRTLKGFLSSSSKCK